MRACMRQSCCAELLGPPPKSSLLDAGWQLDARSMSFHAVAPANTPGNAYKRLQSWHSSSDRVRATAAARSTEESAGNATSGFARTAEVEERRLQGQDNAADQVLISIVAALPGARMLRACVGCKPALSTHSPRCRQFHSINHACCSRPLQSRSRRCPAHQHRRKPSVCCGPYLLSPPSDWDEQAARRIVSSCGLR